MGKKFLIGCGVLFGLGTLAFLFIAVLAVFTAGMQQTSDPTPSDMQSPPQEVAQRETGQQEVQDPGNVDAARASAEQALERKREAQESFQQEMKRARQKQKQQVEQSAARSGDTLTVGGVQWKVTGAKRAKVLKQREFGQFGNTKRGNFVIVDFVFANVSNEPVTLDRVSLALIDNKGRKSQPDTDTFGYVPSELDPFLEQVNPGVSKAGRVVFTVAPDASGFKLQAGDADLFSDKNGYIVLGF